jgi:hypothetical protein
LSQVLRLTDLAPEIQEELLLLPKTRVKTNGITERDLRQVAEVLDWEQQMKKFQSLIDAAQSA